MRPRQAVGPPAGPVGGDLGSTLRSFARPAQPGRRASPSIVNGGGWLARRKDRAREFCCCARVDSQCGWLTEIPGINVRLRFASKRPPRSESIMARDRTGGRDLRAETVTNGWSGFASGSNNSADFLFFGAVPRRGLGDRAVPLRAALAWWRAGSISHSEPDIKRVWWSDDHPVCAWGWRR